MVPVKRRKIRAEPLLNCTFDRKKLKGRIFCKKWPTLIYIFFIKLYFQQFLPIYKNNLNKPN